MYIDTVSPSYHAQLLGRSQQRLPIYRALIGLPACETILRLASPIYCLGTQHIATSNAWDGQKLLVHSQSILPLSLFTKFLCALLSRGFLEDWWCWMGCRSLDATTQLVPPPPISCRPRAARSAIVSQ